MKIFVDVDNTLGNLIQHYLIWYNNLFIYPEKDEKPLDVNVLGTITTWEFPNYTLQMRKDKSSYPEELNRLITIFNSHDFWRTELLLPNAQEVLSELDGKYEVYLLTSPSFKSTNFFNGRVEWVRRNFPDFDYNKIIFCKNKSLLGCDGNSFLIDDNPEMIESWSGWTIKIEYPFNFGFRANRTIKPTELEKVPKLIESILTEKGK